MDHSNLVLNVEAILAMAEPPITDDCCIYRIPDDLRKVNADAYTPLLISIGPLHHYDQRLQKMERYKQVYFKKFIARSKTKLEDLIGFVKAVEPKLRRCYSENLEMSTDELVKVILVDACFIVELFCKRYYVNEWTNDDRNMLKPALLLVISLDLLLLENQVPFFILEKLYNLAFASHKDYNSHSFLELSIKFFEYFKQQNVEPNFTMCHFTDLLRTFHLQKPSPGRKNKSFEPIPTATAFNEAGGKFEKNEASESPLDLRFSKGCLKIPRIDWDNATEILFRNMVALEQCHYPHDGYITDYVVVMDFLINTVKDVDMLAKNEILRPWLGDNDAVARMFNSLTTNVAFGFDFNSQYLDLFKELNVFYKDGWRQMRATLKRDYCNTPWQTLATCAATAILFLTLTQTIFSILQAV